MYPKLAILITFFLAANSASLRAQDKTKAAALRTVATGSSSPPQKHTQEGISVEFSAAPVSSDSERTVELQTGTEATISFKIFDVSANKALSNLRPAAWIDQRQLGQTTDSRECREKIQSFLQSGFARRPTIDLNTYFILALNDEPNISVIDPLSGFGGSKLYTLVPLRSSGADWVMSEDKKRLYVSMPGVDQVAVVDTLSWKVIANLDVGRRPARVALQHDGRYLWVGNDDASEKESGVTTIDTVSLKVAAQFITGCGHHEIAFNDDDSLAFITNKQDGTLSIIDIRKLSSIANTKVGSLPSAIAFSVLSKAFYVANEGDGTIAELDGSGRETRRMKAQPGLGSLRFLSNGRFGFALNGLTNTVYVFDVGSNRIIHAVPVGPGADQIAFTREFAYVRSANNEYVNMIKIADLEREAAVSRFPAGQRAPRQSPAKSIADAIVPAPEGGSVLVANPADQMIYFYSEGMAAPMGSFQNYRRDPKALLVLDNSVRESTRGEYTTTIRLPSAGHYDVAFLLDSPRLVTCFDMTVADNRDLRKLATAGIKIEPVLKDEIAQVGENHNFRFRVIDPISNKARANLEDVGVLVFLAPGIWQQRAWAKSLGDGLYEISFVPPQAGVYYVYFQCPSLAVQFNQIPPVTLQAMKKR